MTLRVGHGYDSHRFAEGRPLILGGVEIPHPRGLGGWSDADVVLHALIDALLGAAALGDIGEHFPPGVEETRNAESGELVEQVVARLREAGFRPLQCDLTVIAEAPRLGAHRAEIRESVARRLGVPTGAVGFKATTNEGMGWLGRREGIAAFAVATVEEIP